jgi:uncharacterized protein YjbI with pentapeptide repeats
LGANLTNANLRGAILFAAQMKGAKLQHTDFRGATWLNGALCQEGSFGECKLTHPPIKPAPAPAKK